MNIYYIFCFLFVIALLIHWLAQYVWKIQTTIVITAGGLIASCIIILLGHLNIRHVNIEERVINLVDRVDFQDFLLDGVLGFLLFAGSININLTALKEQKWEIGVLSIVSTIISTLLIGFGLFATTTLIHFPIPLLYCFIFGAIISPTDPIAVLAIIKTLNAPKHIAIQVEGESLFNDGVGLVIFATLFNVLLSHHQPTIPGIISLFLMKAMGGVVYGAIVGILIHVILKYTRDNMLKLLITLLIPTAGFALANVLGISGALAMVVSGIIIGNWSRTAYFESEDSPMFSHFWEVVEHGLNALLFMLIGLCLITINYHSIFILFIIIAIILCLVVRYISVFLPFCAFKIWREYNPYSVKILTWGGLRGGLGLAMALSLPAKQMMVMQNHIDIREIIIVMTYSVVVFSILIQGSTISGMIKRAKQSPQSSE